MDSELSRAETIGPIGKIGPGALRLPSSGSIPVGQILSGGPISSSVYVTGVNDHPRLHGGKDRWKCSSDREGRSNSTSRWSEAEA